MITRTETKSVPARTGRWWLALALSALVVNGVAGKPDKPDKPGQSKGKGHGNADGFTPPGQSDRGPPGLADKGGVPPGLRRAPLEIRVDKAPPPLRVEKMLPRPSVTHVWIPGYWMWETQTYIWVPGAWIAPPEPAAVWVAPRFETRSGATVFITGYWKL
jgi:hypothetical protein